MPVKTCALGFDCASMMQTPGLLSKDCLNAKECGLVLSITQEEREQLRLQAIEEQRVLYLRQENELLKYNITRDRIDQIIRQGNFNLMVDAVKMLLNRGATQTVETIGLTQSLATFSNLIDSIEESLSQIQGQYIAPNNTEVCIYNVKRPKGLFEYYKLKATEPIFEASPDQRRHPRLEKVKDIHLNRDHRYHEANAGIERRNKLNQAKTLISNSLDLLREANNLINTLPNQNSPLSEITITLE